MKVSSKKIASKMLIKLPDEFLQELGRAVVRGNVNRIKVLKNKVLKGN